MTTQREKGALLRQREAVRQARQRAYERMELRREDARQLLQAKRYISTLHELSDTLRQGYETTDTGEKVPFSNARVGSLRASADIEMKLLDRILPPLRAIEITHEDPSGGDPMRMTTSELLKLVARATQSVDAEFETLQTVNEAAPVAPQAPKPPPVDLSHGTRGLPRVDLTGRSIGKPPWE